MRVYYLGESTTSKTRIRGKSQLENNDTLQRLSSRKAVTFAETRYGAGSRVSARERRVFSKLTEVYQNIMKAGGWLNLAGSGAMAVTVTLQIFPTLAAGNGGGGEPLAITTTKTFGLDRVGFVLFT